MWSSDNDLDEQTSRTDLEYVGSHLRRQLSFDLWYIFIGFFILTISEGTKLQYDPAFTMFGVLFEVVSAYGTVGLSLGYPGVNASLSSQFSTVGKLVIIAMMIRGRHRGLPYGLDRAVLLPSESLHAKETADANARLARRNSGISQVPTQRPRGRSLSTDRGNANVVTRFLHPGPPAAIDHFGHQLTRRATTNPRLDDEDAENPRLHARRVQTTSAFKSNGLL